MSNLTAQVTSDVVNALGSVVDLEPEVSDAFTQTISSVLSKYYLATEAPSTTTSSGGEGLKVQLKRKKKKRDTSNRKPSKNAYHFFVAAKMPEVKASGVEAKQRMATIGAMWKSVTETEKAPFVEAANAFNSTVAELTQTEGWDKTEVQDAAQTAAVAVLSSTSSA